MESNRGNSDNYHNPKLAAEGKCSCGSCRSSNKLSTKLKTKYFRKAWRREITTQTTTIIIERWRLSHQIRPQDMTLLTKIIFFLKITMHLNQITTAHIRILPIIELELKKLVIKIMICFRRENFRAIRLILRHI